MQDQELHSHCPMHIEAFRSYCLAKAGATEGFPFDNDTLVFKVAGKMFALLSLDGPSSANLKCDPEYALELREKHPESVLPGYHMNKKYWNTVNFDGRLSDAFLYELVDHSYQLVVDKLPKKTQVQLAEESADK